MECDDLEVRGRFEYKGHCFELIHDFGICILEGDGDELMDLLTFS
jgi:hypothetical protein